MSPEAFDATGRVTVVVDETEDPVLTAVTTTRRNGSVARLRRLHIAATNGDIHTVEEHQPLHGHALARAMADACGRSAMRPQPLTTLRRMPP